MTRHRPNAGKITPDKKNLLIVAAEDLVADVHEARGDVDPHESKVPLQCAAEPSAQGESLRPVEQVLLRDLCSEAREGPKDLQSAAYHYEQRDGIHPVTKPHHKRVLVDG